MFGPPHPHRTGLPLRYLEVARYNSSCGAYGELVGWIWQMSSSSGVSETWRDAGGDLSLTRTRIHSPPDVKTGRSTPRSLQKSPLWGVSFFFLLRIWLCAMGKPITWLGCGVFLYVCMRMYAPVGLVNFQR